MNVQGIAKSHSSSVCLMRSSAVLEMIQAVRFTKRTNQVAFPVGRLRLPVDGHVGGDSAQIPRVLCAERKLSCKWEAVAKALELLGRQAR